MRAATAALVVAVLLAAGCGDKEDERAAGPVLTVYASVPLLGPSAPAGRDVLDGERLALAGAHGTAARVRVRLVALDAADPQARRTTPARVALNARRAARDPSTIAYLGEVDPAASAVSVTILNEKGILQLSPADTFAGLTEAAGDAADEPAKFYPTRSRTFGRLVPDDNVLARAVVERLRRTGAHRLALIDDDGLYGRSLTLAAARAARAARLRVVLELGVGPPGRRAAAIVARLRPARPDAVLFGGEPAPGLALVWRAVHASLPAARLLAPAALAVPAFYRGIGAAGARTEVASPALPPPALGASARPFRRAFATRFRRPPGPWAPYGFETMRTLLRALRSAAPHARNRRRVVAAALATRVERSTFGAYALVHGATSRRTVGFFAVRDGELRLVGRRPPPG